ncbi:MAG: glycosyltransferase [Puniceicoccaceae bacterium]
MKLTWFSPLPPDQTDIGSLTARILPALASRFDLKVYTSTSKWESSLGKLCPISSFNTPSMDWKALHHEGLPVYHIGNHIRFHGEIITAAKKCPGIVVLHDLAVHETILNLCMEKGRGLAEYFDILCRFCGHEAVEHGRDFLEKRVVNNDKLVMEYPLFEYIVENSLGIITHNPLSVHPIRKYSSAPVMYAPLPFLPEADLQPEIRRQKRDNGPYQIIIFGFMENPNRRLRPFLEAFSKTPSKDRFKVIIAGKYDEKQLKQWLGELDLHGSVTTKGFVSNKGLDKLLGESDLSINLRWPSRGESSGSLLRQWNFSLPALVTNTAYYSTLPGETVATVSPSNEEADIIRHLEAFCEDPDPYFQMGLAGRKLLEEHHTGEVFASHLESFLPMVDSSRGTPYLQTFGKRLARDFLSDYAIPEARPALMERCAGELESWT